MLGSRYFLSKRIVLNSKSISVLFYHQIGRRDQRRLPFQLCESKKDTLKWFNERLQNSRFIPNHVTSTVDLRIFKHVHLILRISTRECRVTKKSNKTHAVMESCETWIKLDVPCMKHSSWNGIIARKG